MGPTPYFNSDFVRSIVERRCTVDFRISDLTDDQVSEVLSAFVEADGTIDDGRSAFIDAAAERLKGRVRADGDEPVGASKPREAERTHNHFRIVYSNSEGGDFQGYIANNPLHALAIINAFGERGAMVGEGLVTEVSEGNIKETLTHIAARSVPSPVFDRALCIYKVSMGRHAPGPMMSTQNGAAAAARIAQARYGIECVVSKVPIFDATEAGAAASALGAMATP